MKLLLCEHCWDVFKLSYKMKTCECGEVKGRYINQIEAEVSPNAVSLAIGNGSLMQGVGLMKAFHRGHPSADRDFYIENAPIRYAWVRPNEGPGNPHCRVIKEPLCATTVKAPKKKATGTTTAGKRRTSASAPADSTPKK